MKKSILWIIVIIIVIAGVWLWKSSSYTPTDYQATTTPAGTVGTTTTMGESYTPTLGIDTTDELGDYLVAANGMTLYLYTKDTPGVSNCSGQCLVNWPAYTVSSSTDLTDLQEGIDAAKIGTITRDDGTVQMTYAGMPLYFWKNDQKIGDTTGQNVGGVWFVVHP